MKHVPALTAVIIAFSVFCLQACFPKMRSTIISSHYDKTKNTTTYMVLPYGTAIMQGEWTTGKYFQPARQQWFRNKDSVSVSLSFGPANKFEFSQEGLNGFAFAMAFYEWEAKYESEHLRQKIKIIEADSLNKYVIAKVYSDSMNTIALFGGRACTCKDGAYQHFTISSKKISDDEMIKFLQSIYLNK